MSNKPTNMKSKWFRDIWEGCYPSQWKGMIVPDAMAHPAKFSSRLIRRIYEHMIDEGWLKRGDTVIDPFGGIALGALDAMRLGLRWRGIELEAKFVGLGKQNIELWNKKFSRMPQWSGDAVLFQGDSRKLYSIINCPELYERAQMEDALVSSPPYKNEIEGGGLNINKPASFRGVLREGSLSMGVSDGNLGVMDDNNFEGAVSSPPYNLPMSQDHNGKRGGTRGTTPSEDGAFVKYGNTKGQLEGMASSDIGFNAAISSPPFRHSEGGTPEPKPGGVIDEGLYARHAAGNSAANGYGVSDGQLANMGKGDFEGAVSSPPYEAGVVKDRRSDLEKSRMEAKGYKPAGSAGMTGDRLLGEAYGHGDGQLADETGDDFWMAARIIVEQVYMALTPGAHACWVVKGFVKNKAYVDFPDQWRQLCEAVGFVTLHEHRASLVHRKGSSMTLEGGTVEHKTESKSFFRRLAEKKGSPRIDYETVWCMVKPALSHPSHPQTEAL
jgi:hypothetical protein